MMFPTTIAAAPPIDMANGSGKVSVNGGVPADSDARLLGIGLSMESALGTLPAPPLPSTRIDASAARGNPAGSARGTLLE